MWPSPPFFFEATCPFPSTPSILLEPLSGCTSSYERHSRLVKNSTAVALSITNVNSASSRTVVCKSVDEHFPWLFSAGVFAIRRGD
jgi:hypothetical protein